MLDSMMQGPVTNLSGVPSRPQQENDAIPRVAPKWLKHDRQVSKTGWSHCVCCSREGRRLGLALCVFYLLYTGAALATLLLI